jgi:amino acid transporter
VGSGSALARAGPLGLLLGYSIYALLVWSTFNAMGEMVVWLPVDGSFVVFAHAYLDDAWGFALGWLYTVTNSLSAAGEVAAVAAIFNYWTDSVNSGGLSRFRVLKRGGMADGVQPSTWPSCPPLSSPSTCLESVSTERESSTFLCSKSFSFSAF